LRTAVRKLKALESAEASEVIELAAGKLVPAARELAEAATASTGRIEQDDLEKTLLLCELGAALDPAFPWQPTMPALLRRVEPDGLTLRDASVLCTWGGLAFEQDRGLILIRGVLRVEVAGSAAKARELEQRVLGDDAAREALGQLIEAEREAPLTVVDVWRAARILRRWKAPRRRRALDQIAAAGAHGAVTVAESKALADALAYPIAGRIDGARQALGPVLRRFVHSMTKAFDKSHSLALLRRSYGPELDEL